MYYACEFVSEHPACLYAAAAHTYRQTLDLKVCARAWSSWNVRIFDRIYYLCYRVIDLILIARHIYRNNLLHFGSCVSIFGTGMVIMHMMEMIQRTLALVIGIFIGFILVHVASVFVWFLVNYVSAIVADRLLWSGHLCIANVAHLGHARCACLQSRRGTSWLACRASTALHVRPSRHLALTLLRPSHARSLHQILLQCRLSRGF